MTNAPAKSDVVASSSNIEKKNEAKAIKSKPIVKKAKNKVKIEKPGEAAKLTKTNKPVRTPKKIKATKIDKPAKAVKTEKSKSVLTDFVMSTFKASNKILQAKDIVNLAIKKFNLPEEKKGQLRLTIAGILFRGEKTHGTIKSIKEKNLRGAFYGLTEWFDADGSLQKDKRS